VSKIDPEECFWNTCGPRTALGRVNSGQFSAQRGSTYSLIFESVRGLSYSKNSQIWTGHGQLLVEGFHIKKDHSYSKKT
jgi:hypothetical protein